MNPRSDELSPKSIIRSAFKNVVESIVFDEDIVRQYFSENYVQTVDGKTLGFDQFLAHMKKQKDAICSAKVQFLAIINEGEIVFTNHEVSVVKKEGAHAKFKVIAQFIVQKGRIVSCDELTRMIEGQTQDEDLGSRH